MKTTDRLSLGLTQLGGSLKAIISVALQSRRPAPKPQKAPERPLLILGNGPSLNDTLSTQRPAMTGYDLLAVNFAANTPVFTELKPQHYVLADPVFFDKLDDANVSRLWQNLDAADWPMTLHLPARMLGRKRAREWAAKSAGHTLSSFNMVAAEGFPRLNRFLFAQGLAMPRPRNVLIPSIMLGLRLGYERIVIVGADHTWTRTLSVDEHNRVVSIQPHFYKDNDKEQERVASVYQNVRLHDVLGSMAIAFRSYHAIADYARRHGVDILNATPGSFIDAFPRLRYI